MVLFVSLFLMSFPQAFADGYTTNQPSHQTLFTDTITSKTDGSSVNIADLQGLFVTGDITTLGNVGIGTTNPTQKLHVFDSAADVRLKVDAGTGTGRQATIEVTHSGTDWSQLNFNQEASRQFGVSVFGSDNKLYIHGPSTTTDRFVTVDSSGNVGIGTTSPSAPLHVRGGNGILIDQPTTSGTINLDFTSGDARAIFKESGGGDRVAIRTNGDSFFNGGNVGIGTTTPTAKLHIGGTAGVDGIRFPDGTLQTTAGGGGGGGAGGWTDDGSVVRLTTSTDNVGIGTIVPNRPLEISKTSDANIRLTDSDGTNAAAYMEFYDATTRLGYVGLPGDGNEDLYIATESGRDIILNPAGNVGIGTTGPSQKAHIYASSGDVGLRVETDSAGTSFIQLDGVQTTDALLSYIDTYNAGDSVAEISSYREGANDAANLRFYTQATGGSLTERVRITSAGNVGIGTTSPSGKLHVAGGAVLLDNNQAIQGRNAANSANVDVLKLDTNDFILLPQANVVMGGNVRVQKMSASAPGAGQSVTLDFDPPPVSAGTLLIFLRGHVNIDRQVFDEYKWVTNCGGSDVSIQQVGTQMILGAGEGNTLTVTEDSPVGGTIRMVGGGASAGTTIHLHATAIYMDRVNYYAQYCGP